MSKRVLLLTFLLTVIYRSWTFTNVALFKPAEHNSYYDFPNQRAYKAVDGNKNNTMAGRSCSSALIMTAGNIIWWMVDLLGVYEISAVELTSVTSKPQELRSFLVEISMTNPKHLPGFPGVTGQVCLNRSEGLDPGVTETLYCDQPETGRYVRVLKLESLDLTICEIEVLVDPSGGVKHRNQEIFHSRANMKSSVPSYKSPASVGSLLECAFSCLRDKDGFCTVFEWSIAAHECNLLEVSEMTDKIAVYPNKTWDTYVSDSN